MTLPSIVRIFFAVDLPEATKKELGKYISTLKKRSKTNAIRWSKPENLHITLQFLGEVRTEDLDKLIKNVRQQVEKIITNVAVTVGHLQLFPNPFRPRVIVLHITPQDQLAILASLIGTGIQQTQYETDQRPFKAHLTLGRIKHAQSVNLGFLTEFAAPVVDTIPVEEVVLFRSEPQPEGSRYTVLQKIRLNRR